MHAYHRILAAVDLSSRGEQVARRALHVSRLCGARLLVAHVVDHHTGFESDHVPFLTPQEIRAELAKVAGRRLEEMMERIGATEAQTRVETGPSGKAVAELAAGWQPDLVIVGSHAPHDLQGARRLNHPFDVLVVQMESRNLAGRLLHSLAAQLSW
jgi:universal stress protein A